MSTQANLPEINEREQRATRLLRTTWSLVIIAGLLVSAGFLYHWADKLNRILDLKHPHVYMGLLAFAVTLVIVIVHPSKKKPTFFVEERRALIAWGVCTMLGLVFYVLAIAENTSWFKYKLFSYLGLDFFTGAAGILFAYLWIRHGRHKTRAATEEQVIPRITAAFQARATSDWTLDSIEEADKQLNEAVSKVRYAPGKLGFFDDRLWQTDPRLLLNSNQLEELGALGAKARALRIIEKEKKNQGAKVDDGTKREPELPPDPFPVPPLELLQPSYAIGKGLISQDEYDNLRNEYSAEGDLSFGLILPLALLAIVLPYKLGVMADWWQVFIITVLLFVATFSLFWVGMERSHKFRMEVKLLILGKWDKAREAAEKEKSKTNNSGSQTGAKGVTNSLQVEVKPLDVSLRTGPTIDQAPGTMPNPAPRETPSQKSGTTTGSIGGDVFTKGDKGTEHGKQ